MVRRNLYGLLFISLMLVVVLACGGTTPSKDAASPTPFPTPAKSFVETFDSLGAWGSGSDEDVEGDINNGQFEILVKAESGLFWSTAGRDVDNGTYELHATQLAGPLNNGYGMLFRVDDATDNFYMFEVSGDGFVWIGRCMAGCEDESTTIVNDNWFESEAVKQGLNQTNVLRVEANGSDLIFFVNDQEVGRATEATFASGNVGVFVETLGEGGVQVAFDNFKYTEAE